jgi:hypothetical protein
MMRATADQPAWSPVSITEANSNQWNSYGTVILPDWVAEDLVGLANVVITVIGAPSATSLNISVGSPTGKIDADGAFEMIPISGIDPTDFVVVKASDGSSQTVSFTDNADGTYSGSGTAIEDGSVDIKPPETMASTGLLIESKGPTTFTII